MNPDRDPAPAPTATAEIGPAAFSSRTLSQQIADTLIGDILTRRIAPGTHLREVALTQRFGASRAAIREALHFVRSTGLVDEVAWKGARVVALTRSELIDLNAIRGLIFGFTVRRAAERATRQDHLALIRIFGELSAAARSGSAEAYELIRWRLHVQLLKAAGGRKGGRRLVERMDHCWEIESIRTPEQRQASVERWTRLLDLIVRGEAAAAEAHARAMNDVVSAIELEAYDRLGGEQWCP